ncbi:MAG: enoyl-CoA hydratase/isomerase family protein [Planctomycetes bacterium]|nr:enoyl-CoA hydratase/isomerase family protein [Planctomycetota bacterium]
MSFEFLKITNTDGIARVTIDRPKANALNRQVVLELNRCFTQLRDDDSVRAVIFTGAGDKFFVAGADIGGLAEFANKADALAARADSRLGQDTLNIIENLGKPSVAAINGFCLGGGLELALAFTLRTASRNAKLGLPEVSLGIIPGYGGTQRLARLAGPAVAREWILTGDHFGADEAHRVGVVNRVYESAELLSATETLVKTILSRGQIAVRYAMEAISRGLETSLADGQRLESDLFGILATTQDTKEGLNAFVEKRPAKFTGK